MSDLAGYAEDRLVIGEPDGTQRPAHAPIDLIDVIEILRDVMYQPGEGTWYSASVSVSRSRQVSADFNYDTEPHWETGISPILYAQDVEKYPRDDANIPGWLQQRLTEADSVGPPDKVQRHTMFAAS